MRLVICSEHTKKFFVEYANTFNNAIIWDGSDQQLTTSYDEILAMQILSVIPAYIWNHHSNIGVINTEAMCCADRKERLVKEVKAMQALYQRTITIYDYSLHNCMLLNQEGLKTQLQEYISPAAELSYLSGLLATMPKQYDIAFVGCLNPRRKEVLDTCTNYGMSVHNVELFGNERDIEIAKCRLLLNIHYYDDFLEYETIRCNRWSQAGLPVVTETNRSTPEGVVSAALADLPIACLNVLHHQT